MMFNEELESDERILWTGQPRQGLVFHAFDIFFIPFSLLWGGFAIFWETAVILGRAPIFFALWGVPFVLVGLYLIVGRFFLDAKQRQKTYYALTDKRIMILTGFLSRTVRTVNLKALSDISINLKSDGRGTVTFGPTMPYAAWYSAFAWTGAGRYIAPTFDDIADAKRLYELVRKAQREIQVRD